MNTIYTPIPTVILAGGQSLRLRLNGKRKWQLPFGQLSLLDYIIKRLSQQTDLIVMNIQYSDSKLLPPLKYPIIYDNTDTTGKIQIKGPLAGLISSLQWARENSYPWVATIPCDTPFFPDNLLSVLSSHVSEHSALAAIAQHNDQHHAVFGVWSTELYDKLISSVVHDNVRAIGKWAALHATAITFPSHQQNFYIIDPFFNINTLNDYQQALSYLDKGYPCL